MSNQLLYHIHIGKCGGTTIQRYFENQYIPSNPSTTVLECHGSYGRQVVYDCNANYVICIRNPIDRVVSAFNWRYYRICTDPSQIGCHPGELETFEKYKTIDELCSKLYNGSVLNKNVYDDLFAVCHIYTNISFYLTELLSKINKDKILFVFKQENLENDLRNFFNIEHLPFGKINEYNSMPDKFKKPKHLSDQSVINLKKVLKKDYDCLKKLIDMGKIPSEFTKYYI